MDRLKLSDEQWERIAPHLPGEVDNPGDRIRTIACSWKACCGLRAWALRGGTCRGVRQLGLGHQGVCADER